MPARALGILPISRAFRLSCEEVKCAILAMTARNQPSKKKGEYALVYMPKLQNHGGEHPDSLVRSEVNCAILAMTAIKQPPQPLQAKAKPKRAKGNKGRRAQLSSQHSLVEAKQRAQSPQLSLAEAKAKGKQVKPRRRRGKRALSTHKRPREKEECSQAEVNSKRRRLTPGQDS